MGVIEASLIEEGDELATRALNVRHSRGSFATPAYAVNIAEFDRNIIKENDLQGIAEVSISFTPERLKDLNKDARRQQQMEDKINSLMSRALRNQLVVGLPILKGKKRRELSSNEASSYGTYIAELIAHPRTDVVCTPIFHRVAETNVEVLMENFFRGYDFL